jgi:hypothetical protein
MQQTEQEAGPTGQDRSMACSPRFQGSNSELDAALREMTATGRRKGINYLRPKELIGLACVWPKGAMHMVGDRGYYKSIAHHADAGRFKRHDFIVIPDSPAPTHDELYAIALATVTMNADAPDPSSCHDITDRLRAKLAYPKSHARTCRLLEDLALPIPSNAVARYMEYVRQTVTDNLLSPWHEPPGTRAMRIKLVFIDALPFVPDDPRLTDFDALVELAEAVSMEAV